MKIEKFGRYYIIQAILIIFEVVINLIIFAVPLAVNQIINGKLALTDRVIAFIIGFMLLEICIQFVYLLIELHMQKEYKKNLSKEIYQKIYSMKYAGHKLVLQPNIPFAQLHISSQDRGQSPAGLVAV